VIGVGKRKTASQPYTVRAREMGAELVEHREARKMSVRELAERLGWWPPHVSQMETGRRPPSPMDVAAYLGGCGPHERDEYYRLVALASEPDTRYLVRAHGSDSPDEMRSLVVQESLANVITEYEPLVVSGLLQSEGYMRALLRWGSTRPQDEIESRIQARLARQRLLHREDPPKCTFFLQEHVLRTVVGDCTVMTEQMLYLMLTAELRHCSLRVVLDSAGPFAASTGGFRVMDYAKYPPVVYMDTSAAGVYIDEPDDVVRYRAHLARLDKAALGEEESRAWLADLAGAYDRAEAASSCPPPSEPG
jgi:transcriptional regulator with XRE-family HTH domain